MALESHIRQAAQAGREGPPTDVRYSDDRAMALLASPYTTAEQDHDAAFVLAGWALDSAELRLWLEMCGLKESTP